MASLVVRGLDDSVKEGLTRRAREHGRSMEAEVREILTQASSRPHVGLSFLHAARTVTDDNGDIPVPERRGEARVAELQ